MKTFYQFLTIVALGALMSSCGGGGRTGSADSTSTTPDTAVHIRYNVNSPKGLLALAAMDKALKIMRNIDCSDPTSWYYQGAIHWVPDSIPTTNPLCPSYTHKAQLKPSWDNCTHFLANGGAEINFLIWHRLYIYHFENIVRKLSGDKSFALPYWAYTNTTDTVANRTLNLLLRTKGSGLYTASRYDSLNRGFPLSGAIIPALDLTVLNQNTDLVTYSNQINAAPHGAMHNYIGAGNDETYMIYNEIYQKVYDGGLMANVPSAGFDPVFWLHHSNIDRIWQQWTNSANGQRITLEDLKAHPFPYNFFDENGKPVSYTPEEIIKIIYNLNYRFDDTPMGTTPTEDAQKTKPSVMLSAAIQTDTIVKKDVSKTITGKSLIFTVPNQHKQNIALMTTKNSAGKHKTVIVKLTVTVAKEPRGIYQVYINLPKGTAPNPKGNYFAGFMTFFGASHHAAMNMPGMESEPEMTFYFDLTDEFAKTAALSKDNLSVSILNNSGKGLGNFTVKSITVIVK